MTIPRGIRNNNPGNIRYVEGVTSTYAGCTGSDGAFEIFDTPEHGIQALASLLLTYQRKHGINTIRAAINRWAPPIENDTGAYVNAVAREVGYDADDLLDFADPGLLYAFVVAIIRHENGQQPYTAGQISAGVSAALGIRREDVAATQIDVGAAPADTGMQYPQPAAATPLRPESGRIRTAKPAQEAAMGLIGLLRIFGPILAGFIPQVAKVVNPQPNEVAGRNIELAQVIVDTIIKSAAAAQTAGQPITNLQGAVEAMQADPELRKTVQQAVVNEPAIMGLLEVGGGIQVARIANLAMQNAEKPFWYNPAFWMSIILLPMAYWIVGAVLIGGIEIRSEDSQLWKIFGDSFDAETRSGVVNLVLGMVLGGIVGIWFGTSYGSMRKTELTAQGKDGV